MSFSWDLCSSHYVYVSGNDRKSPTDTTPSFTCICITQRYGHTPPDICSIKDIGKYYKKLKTIIDVMAAQNFLNGSQVNPMSSMEKQMPGHKQQPQGNTTG